MYNTPNDLLDALRAAPEIYAALLAGVTHEQALAAKGGDEGWSVVEVLCHLRDAEECALLRVEQIRDHDNPVIEAYDQDQWARDRHYAEGKLSEAWNGFLHFRARHITALAALAPEAWERSGHHTEVGLITILNHTQHIAAHDAIHAAQIARQLERAKR